MSDMVNHPPHYNSHPSGIQCIEITEHMNFNVGNAIKYLWRADAKGAPIEDLKKACWYIQREIERRTKLGAPIIKNCEAVGPKWAGTIKEYPIHPWNPSTHSESQ